MSGQPHRPARSGRPSDRRRPKVHTRNTARRSVDPARQAAWWVLRAVDEDDAYANLVLPRYLRELGLHGRDAGFATELAYGTLRGRGTYDAILAACVDRELTAVEAPLLDALRMGVHQALRMRVPAHAATDSTVDLVRAEVGQGAAGFANAIMRKVVTRDLDGWLGQVAPDGGDTGAGTGGAADADTRLSVVHSHPVWVVRALRDALVASGRPAGELTALLRADNESPLVAVAALPGLADPAELAGPASGEQVRPGTVSPVAVRVSGPPSALDAVRQGRARVQDEGSQLVALALAAAETAGPDGGRWLDLCAGPGGKAALLGATLAGRVRAGALPEGARLDAVEFAPHRADLVRDSVAALERDRPGTVHVRVGDGRDVGAEEPAGYDRVLVDAPCTGLGALRRRPESRWRRTPSDLAALAPLQRALLASALDAVRPGGVVAYVTCSPHRAETRFVVDDVLRRRDDVQRLDAVPVLAEVSAGRAGDLGEGPDVQLWPHLHGTDAMYLALLRRAGSR